MLRRLAVGAISSPRLFSTFYRTGLQQTRTLTTAVSTSPIQESADEEPQWEIVRLKNDAHYWRYHPWECNEVLRHDKKVERDDFASTESLYLFRNLRWHEPIQEFSLGVHTDGLMTFITVTRPGVYWKARYLLRKFSQDVPRDVYEGTIVEIPHIEKYDKRGKLYLSSFMRKKAENYFRTINKMAPFNRDVSMMLAGLMDRAEYLSDNFQGAIEYKEAEPWQAPETEEYKQTNLPLFINPNAYTLPFGGTSSVFERDDRFPEDYTPLQWAVLNYDLAKIEAILAEDPKAMLEKSPWGDSTVDIVSHLGPHSLDKRFFEIWETIPQRTWREQSAYNSRRASIDSRRENGDEDCTPEERQEKVDGMLQRRSEVPIPQRPQAHQAVLNGDLKQLQALVEETPDCLHEADPWGYTPMVLAVAFNQPHIIQWLLDQGLNMDPVKTKNVCGRDRVFNMSDIANEAEAMGYALRAREKNKIERLNMTLMDMVRCNKRETVEVLLAYGRTFDRDKKGLDPVEWLIAFPDQFQEPKKMLALLLEFYDKRLPDGPYDTRDNFSVEDLPPNCDYPNALPPEMVTLIEKYNKRFDRNAKRVRPSIECMYMNDEGFIETHLELKGEPVLSTIRPVHTLTHKEVFPMIRLSWLNFALKLNPRDIINDLFEKLGRRPGKKGQWFVDVCRMHGKVVSFVFFELHECHYNSEDFTLFHGQLAAVDPEYEANGFPNLTFRVPYAIQKQNPDKRVCVDYKALRPGFGRLLLPEIGSERIFYHPKYERDEGFMQYIMWVIGESFEEGRLRAKIRVRKQAPGLWTIREYERLAGDDEDFAILIFYDVNEYVRGLFIRKLGYGNLNESGLEQLGNMVEVMRQEQKVSQEKVTPDPLPSGPARELKLDR